MPSRPPVLRPPNWKPRAEQQADYNRNRGSSSARGYGRDWQKARLQFLQAHPLCADCEHAGRVTPAAEVHHRIKVTVRPDLRLDQSNLLGLCISCHSVRTRRGE